MASRFFALACLFAASACAPPSVSPAADPHSATAARQVIAIADDYLAAWRDAFPEVNTTNGIPGARHDRLSDNSLDALKNMKLAEDELAAIEKALK